MTSEGQCPEIPPSKSWKSITLGRPDEPNLPNVPGTTLPLVSTVLAVFAFTVVTEFLVSWSYHFPLPLLIGLASLFIASFLLIASTVSSIWAQSYNYFPLLPLDDDRLMLFKLDVNDDDQTLADYHDKLMFYYRIASLLFIMGTVAFLSGIGFVALSAMTVD